METRYNFSAREKKKGNWTLILAYKDQYGKWHQKTKAGFPSKKEAVRSENKEALLRSMSPFLSADNSRSMTLLQFCREYLETRNDLAPNTARSYMECIKILEPVARLPLHKLTYAAIAKKIAELSQTRKPGTVQKYITAVKIMLKECVKWHLLASSPLDGYKFSKRRDEAGTTKIRTFSEQEYLSFFSSPLNDEAFLAFSILRYTGIRRGELLALQWSDVNFDARTISISKQLTRGRNGLYSVSRLKSQNSARIIPIPPILSDALSTYLSSHPDSEDSCVCKIKPHMLRLILKKYSSHSIHDFRHTYATTLIAKGVNPKTVAALLGDTLATVEKVYIHYTDQMRADAAEKIDNIFQ